MAPDMSILITGAAGFIGSFLAEALVKQGYAVVGLDNYFRGKKENIRDIPQDKFQIYDIDLSFSQNIPVIHTILIKHEITIVFHLAAINGTQYFYDQPYFVLDQNVRITQTLLDTLIGTSVKYLIYTSSSEVYGDAMQFPTPETHPILLHENADRDSYAASKALSELYVRLFTRQHGIDHLILRVFNIYGERMVGTRYGQVIPEFIQRILHENKFTLIGDGKQTRSFCYVKDLIKMMISLMDDHALDVMNAGNDEELSIDELAQRLHRIVGKTYQPTYLPGRANDHRRRQPDLTILRKVLPELRFTLLDDGLRKTLEFYKGQAL